MKVDLHEIRGLTLYVRDHETHRSVIFPGTAGGSEADPSWWARSHQGGRRVHTDTWDEAVEEIVRHAYTTKAGRAEALPRLRQLLGLEAQAVL